MRNKLLFIYMISRIPIWGVITIFLRLFKYWISFDGFGYTRMVSVHSDIASEV